MTAAADLPEPDLIGPLPHYTINQVKSCAQVFDVLGKPAWTQYDLDRFEAHSPWAYRSELFGDRTEEARHRIRQAADDAHAQIAVRHERSTIGGPRGMSLHGL